MAKRKGKEKDEIDRTLDGIDFHGLTAEEVTGQDGLMKRLSSRILEKMLQAQMDEHLGYARNSNAGDNSGNSRNGYSAKTVITGDNRRLAIEVPRDREGTFTPIAVPKYETHLPLFNDQIIVVLHRNLDKNDKANKVYISKRGNTLWQKKTKLRLKNDVA